MTLRRGLCYLCLFLVLTPVLLILGLYILFVYDILDAIVPDELSDDYPGNPKTFPTIPTLNVVSHRDILGGDGTIRRGGYKWIYVHGNSSCYSEDTDLCVTFDSAFTTLVHKYAHTDPLLLRSLTTLDCDAYPPLCNDYFVRPPALVHVSSDGPCEFRRGEVEGWDFFCPVSNRLIFLPLYKEEFPLNGHFPDGKSQLSRFFEGECMWEVSKTIEQIQEEIFAGPDEDDGWLEWGVWQIGTGIGYGIVGIVKTWDWIAGG